MKINFSPKSMFPKGLLLISFPIFFNERFTFSWISIAIYILLIFSGVSILLYSVARFLKTNPIYLFLIVILSEISIYSFILLVKNNTITSTSIKERTHYYYTSYLRNIPVFQKELGQYDPNLFYTLKTGYGTNNNLEFKNIYSVNSQGLRDDETSLKHPAIIALGDSHTMGFGVNQDELYTSHLEKKINQKVLNAGIISYGTARELLTFNKLKTDSCKTIIWQYCPNDIEENINYLENDHHLNISSKRTLEFAGFKNFLNANYYPFKLSFELLAHQFRVLIPCKKKSSEDFPASTHVDYFFKIIQKLQKEFDGEIILFSLKSYSSDNSIALAFKKFIYENNLKKIRVIDFSKILKEENFYIIDEHINASGHQKIGETIYQLMTNNTEIVKSKRNIIPQ